MTNIIIKNGLPVIESGPVVIEGTRHQVRGFFVACNATLNARAWNTTEEKQICSQCFASTKTPKPEVRQLKLFE